MLGVLGGDVDPGGQLITVIRKGTRAIQLLPASPDAFVWLRLYQAQMQGLVPTGPDEPLWWTLRRPFRPLAYHAARAMFVRANASLGSNWSIHDLRHTAAYRMARDPQVPLTDVQWVLGHASLATTQRQSTRCPTLTTPRSKLLSACGRGAGLRPCEKPDGKAPATLLPSGHMRFFTADLHLGHVNIIGFCDRPFASVEATNEALLANWAGTVGEDDEIWVLGDVAMGRIPKRLPPIAALPGHKHLVPGNHDRCWPGNRRVRPEDQQMYVDVGFEIHRGSVSLQLGDFPVVACHFPVAGNSQAEDRFGDHRPEVPADGWLLHGHVQAGRSRARGHQLLRGAVAREPGRRRSVPVPVPASGEDADAPRPLRRQGDAQALHGCRTRRGFGRDGEGAGQGPISRAPEERGDDVRDASRIPRSAAPRHQRPALPNRRNYGEPK